MKKIYKSLLLNLTYAIAFLNMETIVASQNHFFDRKDETFWIIKNKNAFKQAAMECIDEAGNWKAELPIPEYIKYAEELEQEDLPYLERWLSLKGLNCFAISDIIEQPNLSLIYNWYSDLRESENFENKNLHKLAWLNYKTTFNEIQRGTSSILPETWIETNRDYQMKNSHYRVITTH